jgi:hypothetical protein
MNSQAFARSKEGANADELSPLPVMILYEDSMTGRRAKRMLDRVLHEVDLPEPVDLRVCRMNLLHEPRMRARAVRMAAESEIVVLSTYGKEEGLEDVEGWLEEWSRSRSDQPCAFAVLLHDAESPADPNQWLTPLREAAREGNLDFFYAVCPAYPRGAVPAMQQAVRCGAQHQAHAARFPTGSIMEEKPKRHWGINE